MKSFLLFVVTALVVVSCGGRVPAIISPQNGLTCPIQRGGFGGGGQLFYVQLDNGDTDAEVRFSYPNGAIPGVVCEGNNIDTIAYCRTDYNQTTTPTGNQSNYTLIISVHDGNASEFVYVNFTTLSSGYACTL